MNFYPALAGPKIRVGTNAKALIFVRTLTANFGTKYILFHHMVGIIRLFGLP